MIRGYFNLELHKDKQLYLLFFFEVCTCILHINLILHSFISYSWENTGKDIIKCPHCNATLCIKFHHALDQASKANLCSKYLDKLASSHKDVCPFQSFAKRSLKVMERQRKTNNSSAIVSHSDEHNISHDPASLMDRVEMALKKSTVDLFVPPYMLPLCNEMKIFEDYAGDGSVTKQSVEGDAVKIQSQIDARGSVIGVEIPSAVTTYCREVLSDPDVDMFDKSQKTSRDAYLLSAFGWSICDENNGAEGNNRMGILLKCKMCLARSILAATTVDGESPKKKRRRVDSANVKLLDSHRVYCPFLSGFASGDGHQSEPGWKVVLSKLQ
jgi:hypothetical protein